MEYEQTEDKTNRTTCIMMAWPPTEGRKENALPRVISFPRRWRKVKRVGKRRDRQRKQKQKQEEGWGWREESSEVKEREEREREDETMREDVKEKG